jgi:hypothetical protein
MNPLASLYAELSQAAEEQQRAVVQRYKQQVVHLLASENLSDVQSGIEALQSHVLRHPLLFEDTQWESFSLILHNSNLLRATRLSVCQMTRLCQTESNLGLLKVLETLLVGTSSMPANVRESHVFFLELWGQQDPNSEVAELLLELEATLIRAAGGILFPECAALSSTRLRGVFIDAWNHIREWVLPHLVQAPADYTKEPEAQFSLAVQSSGSLPRLLKQCHKQIELVSQLVDTLIVVGAADRNHVGPDDEVAATARWIALDFFEWATCNTCDIEMTEQQNDKDNHLSGGLRAPAPVITHHRWVPLGQQAILHGTVKDLPLQLLALARHMTSAMEIHFEDVLLRFTTIPTGEYQLSQQVPCDIKVAYDATYRRQTESDIGAAVLLFLMEQQPDWSPAVYLQSYIFTGLLPHLVCLMKASAPIALNWLAVMLSRIQDCDMWLPLDTSARYPFKLAATGCLYLSLIDSLLGYTVKIPNTTVRATIHRLLLIPLLQLPHPHARFLVYSSLLDSCPLPQVTALVVHCLKEELSDALAQPSESIFLSDHVVRIIFPIILCDKELGSRIDVVIAALNMLRCVYNCRAPWSILRADNLLIVFCLSAMQLSTGCRSGMGKILSTSAQHSLVRSVMVCGDLSTRLRVPRKTKDIWKKPEVILRSLGCHGFETSNLQHHTASIRQIFRCFLFLFLFCFAVNSACNRLFIHLGCICNTGASRGAIYCRHEGKFNKVSTGNVQYLHLHAEQLA